MEGHFQGPVEYTSVASLIPVIEPTRPLTTTTIPDDRKPVANVGSGSLEHGIGESVRSK